MDPLSALVEGFRVALTPINLLWALAGVTLGTIVGVLPGIGPALTVALLLPVTFSLPPIEAFIMFAGIYYGGMYGGSTTAILLNTPGESASVMTAVEGHLMARTGRGGAALATSAIGSFVAGTLATAALTFLAPVMADAALRFGPAEYFALTLLAFVAVSSVLGDSTLKGLASLFFGLVLGLIGIDPLTGEARLSFGITQLLDGIDVVIVAVGLFAVGESLFAASRTGIDPESVIPLRGSIWMTREDWSRSWRPWLRGTALGFPGGVLPAGGSEIPTFLSYALERRLARDPKAFGNGAIEGVAGPEAANNAAVGGAMVPTLALGIPGSTTTAIILAGLIVQGVRPGPHLFTEQPLLLYAVFSSMLLANLLYLVLGLGFAKVFARISMVPAPYLWPAVFVLSVIGAYAPNQAMAEVWVAIAFGGIGFFMKRYGFSPAPLVIGLVLGPLIEKNLREGLFMSLGEVSVFWQSPIALVIWLVVFVTMLAGPVKGFFERGAAAKAAK